MFRKNNTPDTTGNAYRSGIGPITDRIINSVLDGINTQSFRQILKERMVNFTMEIVLEKMKPYIILSVILYIVIIIFLLAIIIILCRLTKQREALKGVS